MTAPFVKYAFLFPFDIFCFLVKNQVFKVVWIDIRVFYSVLLVLLSVLMPVPGCFQYCSSVVEFEVRDCDTSRSSFIVRIVLAFLGFMLFYMKLSIVLSRSVNNFSGIFMIISLDAKKAF